MRRSKVFGPKHRDEDNCRHKLMKKILPAVLLVFITLSSCDFSSKGESINSYQTPQSALLVMDMQVDFIGPNAKMPIEKSSVPALIENVNAEIENFKAQDKIIIYIRNVFPKNDIANFFRNQAAVEGSSGIAIDQRVKILSALIFDKNQPDTFSNKKFEHFLIDHQISELTLTGVYADQCTFYTAKSALNRGYKVNYLTQSVGAASGAKIQKAARRLAKLGATIK